MRVESLGMKSCHETICAPLVLLAWTVSNRIAASTVTRGLTSTRPPPKSASVVSLHVDGVVAVVKSHTRVGTPLSISPIRPPNAGRASAALPDTSIPPMNWCRRLFDSIGAELTRVPNAHVRLVIVPGLSISGTGPSVSRSITIADTGARSFRRSPAVTLANEDAVHGELVPV